MGGERSNITGVVLTGGRGRRMGGEDKGLVLFRGRPLVAYALETLQQAAGTVLVNANRYAEEYARFGYPVIADRTETFDGPLAGLFSAMLAAQTEYVLTVPCDCPLIDGVLLKRLYFKLREEGAEICSAHDGERMQPVFLIAERRLAVSLSVYLESGQRKVETWLGSHRLALADYRDHPELFANINTPEQLKELESRYSGSSRSDSEDRSELHPLASPPGTILVE
ncbi:MAG: molybdenum cofactor guanylyltransferase [Methylococcaceae bacterium]|nr:molybdenum cofactor guanylyltransferase [Methylococcaceae bacterium]